MATTEQEVSAPKPKQTYEAGCHCGYIKFSVTLSPPLPESKPLQCDCSACRRFGYLLVCTCDRGQRGDFGGIDEGRGADISLPLSLLFFLLLLFL